MGIKMRAKIAPTASITEIKWLKNQFLTSINKAVGFQK
jgi:hypothetical protein